MDKVPECVETVLEYDFQYWDELENYFSKNDGKIIDYRRTEWDPEPPEIRTEVNKHRFMLTCKGPVFTVGDLILTKDYELHRVVKVNY